MSELRDIYTDEKAYSPVTPQTTRPLTSPPSFASPVVSVDAIRWVDSARSPTCDIRRAQTTLSESKELADLTRSQDNIKKSFRAAKQPIRQKMSNPAEVARQARALKEKIDENNLSAPDFKSKGRPTRKTRKSDVRQPSSRLLVEEEDALENMTDCLSPAMHWKTLFQIQVQRQ